MKRVRIIVDSVLACTHVSPCMRRVFSAHGGRSHRARRNWVSQASQQRTRVHTLGGVNDTVIVRAVRALLESEHITLRVGVGVVAKNRVSAQSHITRPYKALCCFSPTQHNTHRHHSIRDVYSMHATFTTHMPIHIYAL